MKFHQNVDFRNDIHRFGKFLHIYQLGSSKGAAIRPQIRPWKIPDLTHMGMFKNNEAFHFMASYAHVCLDFKD